MIKLKSRPIIWTDSIRMAWDLPADITVSQWADKTRVLDTKTSAEPGQWRTDRTPYLRGIMDAFNDPLVEDITIMASTQVGKTESLLNMMGYVIDQDPGPALLVMPRDEDAKSISVSRIRPMLELSGDLARHFTRNLDDVTKKEIQLDRMIVYFTGANSPAGLAQRPIRYLFMDETDKYPAFSGKEADPIKLATERTRTFWNRKIVKVSTPTTKEGYIYREYEKSDKRKYFVPCPHCGEYQILVWDQVKFPANERDPEVIKEKKLAWYECMFCKGRISDSQKQKMLLQGRWVPEACEINKKGQITFEGVIVEDIPTSSRVGFWINALYSPWLTFSDIAAEWLGSYQFTELLMNFVNSWLAEVWEETLGTKKPEEYGRLAQGYEAGTVPGNVIVLTGGVDVQKDHFYYTIRGWGYHQESWLVMAGRCEEWEDVIRIMFKTLYPSEQPGIQPYPVRLTCIDSGYRPDEVYDVCRHWADLARPIKGKDHLNGIPFRVNNIEKFPGNGQPIPGGLLLWHLDTNYFKDKVARLVKNTSLDSPGGWHLYRDPAEEYLKQFCSEHKVPKRDRNKSRAKTIYEWQPVSSHAATHFWDCEIYGSAAAEMLRVFALVPDQGTQVYRPKEKTEIGRESWISRGSWVAKQGGSWIRRNG